MRPRAPRPLSLLLATLLSAAAGQAAAEPAAPPRSGFEVSLHGVAAASPGRPVRLRGVAWEVRGLADLRPLPGARVRGRYVTEAADSHAGPWAEVTAGAGGRFDLVVQVPAGARGPSTIEVSVGDGRAERTVETRLDLLSPYELVFRTDRVLYQPGEPVHLWTLVRDRSSLAPMPGVEVRLSGDRVDLPARSAVTSAMGVASFTVDLPEAADEGEWTARVSAGVGVEEVSASSTFRVGRRHEERLLVGLEVSPAAAGPGAEVTVSVTVTAPSGAAVRDAEVEVRVGTGAPLGARTDASGTAAVRARAPTFLADESGLVPVRATVSHPAHGTAAATGRLRLAMPLALEVEVAAPHGGLVPEVDERLLVSIRDAAGDPPEAGTVVEVSGPAVAGGRARAATDRNGIVAVPARLPRSAAAYRESGDCAYGLATTVDVRVEGPAPRTARLCVRALGEALVAPLLETPIVEPGGRLEVGVARRPAARGAAVVVDLLAAGEARPELVASVVAEPSARSVSLEVPAHRAGLFVVRARPLGVPGASEGAGAEAALIVRPPAPTFPVLEVEREVYPVRGTARLVLRTPPGAPASAAAVLARDLAMHGGEADFRLQFLGEAFDRALLDPAEEGATLLLGAALASRAGEDSGPAVAANLVDELGRPAQGALDLALARGRGDLRDPVAAAEELRRRGVGPVMTALERALDEALDGRADLDAIVEGRGGARRFRPDAVEAAYRASGEELPRALGGAVVTVAMLEAADPSFRFETVARRVARARLVRLLGLLARALEGDGMEPSLLSAREAPERWLSRLVQRGALRPAELQDPWGGAFVLARVARRPAISVAAEAAGLELLSPGPDGRAGTADDVHDPFARTVGPATPYSVASGEDELMAQLAVASPARELLPRLLEAYRRLGEAAREERIGDVASAGVSEAADGGLFLSGTGRGGGGTGEGTIGLGNLGTIGHGGGGGSGSGYGRGAGGLGLRRVAPGGGRGLGALIRERFPATLRFLPDVAVDPSGTTPIELPLADAVTTYRVEAVVWRTDGWMWSTSAEVHVEQDVVADAPVPPFATVGDRVLLPIRVSNRSATPRSLELSAAADPPLGIAPGRAGTMTVPASDGGERTLALALREEGEAVVTVTAAAPDGAILDASRRPMTVEPDARPVEDRAEAIASGRGGLSVEVPAEALALSGSQVRVAVGSALFGGRGPASAGGAWAAALTRRAPGDRDVEAALGALPESAGDPPGPSTSLAVGGLYGHPAAPDDRIEAALLALTATYDVATPAAGAPRREDVLTRAAMLLHLAPALAAADQRPALEGELRALVSSLRESVASGAPAVADAPVLWSAAAAALALTTEPGRGADRARDLLRRGERSVVSVGEDRWLVEGEDEPPYESASVLRALAHLALGEREPAFALLRTAARLDGGPGRRETVSGARLRSPHLLDAALGLLAEGAEARTITLVVDGEARSVELDEGRATVAAPALGRPGRHEVALEGPAGAVLWLEARSDYALPWSVRPAAAGPFALALEGEVGHREGEAELTLVVRNRAPRLVTVPVVEVGLPAGAELDDRARAAIEDAVAGPPALSGRTLRLALRPLSPGAEARVPLPLRWTVGGELRGLGVAAYAADRPRAVSVLPSRVVTVPDR